MPSVHARFGGSTASRWLRCPGSVTLCEQMKASFEEYMELSVDELMAKIEAVSPKPSMKSRAA